MTPDDPDRYWRPLFGADSMAGTARFVLFILAFIVILDVLLQVIKH